MRKELYSRACREGRVHLAEHLALAALLERLAVTQNSLVLREVYYQKVRPPQFPGV